MIPLTAVPLAALGITSAADMLARLVSRVSSDVLDRPLSSHRALGIAALAMLLAAAIIYPNQIGQGATVLQDRYRNQNYSHLLVSGDEQLLYEKLPGQVPVGQTVLGSPFTGAQFASIWSHRGVVIPHTGSNPKPDVALVSHEFKSFTTDPAVCAALKRLRVAVVVDDSDRFQATDKRQASYSGLVNLAGTPGLRLIDKGATVAIYRVGSCKS